jgi:AhpD family alkylhydroperoxidase
MAGIWDTDPTNSRRGGRKLLDGLQERLGMTENMMRVIGASPAALSGYLSLGLALAGGTLDPKFREQIALAVGQAIDCEFCLSRHAAIARKMGLTEDEIIASRVSRSDDSKREAGLKFASRLALWRGKIDANEILHLRAAGYGDAEIAEIAANVAMGILVSFFSHLAGSEVADTFGTARG